MIELTLPLPPTINSYWRAATKKPRQFGSRMRSAQKPLSPITVYISDKGQQFRTDVIAAVLQARANKQLAGRLQVEMVVHPADKRVLDIDNRIKAALDAMTHAGVYIDDSQIDRLVVSRGEIIKGGQCLVVISEVKPKDAHL